MLGSSCDITRGRSFKRACFTRKKCSTPGRAEDGPFPFGDLVDRILSDCCITFTSAPLECKCRIPSHVFKCEPPPSKKI